MPRDSILDGRVSNQPKEVQACMTGGTQRVVAVRQSRPDPGAPGSNDGYNAKLSYNMKFA
jgi:hypothetical protein